MATLKERLEAVLLAIGLDMKSKANSSVLASVAISGSYSDLINKPFLTCSVTANGTDVKSNFYKDITVPGVISGDYVFVSNNYRRTANNSNGGVIISANVTALNTVRLFFNSYFNGNDSNVTVQDPAVTAWVINFIVFKQ